MAFVKCDYRGCENEFHIDDGLMLEAWDGTKWYACPSCEDKVDDSTGYCGLSCQFGHGCNQEC